MARSLVHNTSHVSIILSHVSPSSNLCAFQHLIFIFPLTDLGWTGSPALYILWVEFW